MNPADFQNRLGALQKRSTDKLLTEWRAESSPKTDDDILRDKLTECGWRYSRSLGRWRHPANDSVQAPRTLQELAESIARIIISDALHEWDEQDN